jgi:hypothetical protein
MTKWKQWPVPEGTPLWPTILDAALETVSLSFNVLGERRKSPFALEIEHICFEYLQRALEEVSTVETISYLRFLERSENYNRDATVILNYAVTLKPWEGPAAPSPVALGAVELDIVFAGKMFKPGAGVYSPLGLFLSESDEAHLRDAIIDAMKLHMDEQIIKAVGAFQQGK